MILVEEKVFRFESLEWSMAMNLSQSMNCSDANCKNIEKVSGRLMVGAGTFHAASLVGFKKYAFLYHIFQLLITTRSWEPVTAVPWDLL